MTTMDGMIFEIIGYIGSALVVISMLMSSIIKLRLINTAGSIISCIYALIVGAMPLALMNVCLIIINLYNLYKLLRTSKPYDLTECAPDESMVRYFLAHYRDDIQTFFPEFRADDERNEKAVVVYCEGDPVGIMMGKPDGEDIDVSIEYSTPAYRDCSVGKYLYSRLPELGIKGLKYTGNVTDAHADYLKKMGFVREDDIWVLRTA